MASAFAAVASSTPQGARVAVAPHRARSGRICAARAIRADSRRGRPSTARAVSETAAENDQLPVHLVVPTEYFNTDFVGSERNYDKKIKEVKEVVGKWAENVESGIAHEVTVRVPPPNPRVSSLSLSPPLPLVLSLFLLSLFFF